MKRFVCVLTINLLFFAGWAVAEEPPLPPGLAPSAPAKEEPALPSGLAPAAPAKEDPALPPGLAATTPETESVDEDERHSLRDRLPFDLHGFFDVRGGLRTRSDPANSKTAILGESRLQLKTRLDWDRADIDITADTIGDAVLEEADFDLRQFRLTYAITDSLDLRIGRQVLTWGTGDMLFINDLFPKDWVSFFIGRDQDYLKAPQNAVRLGWYPGPINIEFVYTPKFTHDRFIKGERISFWNPMFNRFDGRRNQVDYNAPSDWFEDDEFALRLYRNIGNYEVAAYGYSGYWKSPGGQRLIPFMQASFPKVNVYGASVRGTLGKGIVNAEIGYYDSRQDRSGSNMLVNNSELRLLLGYERSIGRDFTASVQYYLEHMMDYSAYRNNQLPWIPKRDQDRSVFTLRLTKLLMGQNMTLSWFMYYSPTDRDVYLRPNVSYKVTDQWLVEMGGNVFLGEANSSFFGQFKNNTNLYAGLRYSF